MSIATYGQLCARKICQILPLVAVAGNAMSGSGSDEVAAEAQALMQTFDIPGVAIASIENSKVAWIRTLGRATEDRPVSEDTVFNVASLTKPLFATLVLHEVQAGNFSLDAPLADHWVDPDVHEDPRHELLTARLALSHQTGLPNWRGNNPLAFTFDPGTRHEYSGEGYEYVRRALQQATGESLQERIHDRITGPLSMTETTFGWDDTLTPRLATGFDEQARPMDMAYLEARTPNAAANTFTTVGDYAEFAAWVARGADLSPALFAEMTNPQASFDNPGEFFSIGWRTVTFNDQVVLSHDGREDGVRTQVYVLPESGAGLVVLTNSSNGELLMRGVTRAALPGGSELTAAVDRDTWHFVQSLPANMHAPMLGFIARSPSFISKLLYAVARGAIAPVNEELAARALDLNDSVVIAAHRESVTSEAVATLFQLLLIDSDENPRLRPAFDAEWSELWISALQKLSETS